MDELDSNANSESMSRRGPGFFLKRNILTAFSKPTLLHPQKVLTARLNAIDSQHNPPSAAAPQLSHTTQVRDMSSMKDVNSVDASKPGEHFEPRQTATSEDYTPDPSRSIPLDRPRQALIDDVIALYSCQPTVERVKRYTPDCVYDDQFVYANDRYKMAGQWFALPKLFKSSVNEGYEVVKNEPNFIQFKNKQAWTFKLIPKTATITGLVSLSLDPSTANSDFIQIKYHKDQAVSER
jgi:hypothetical protein